jgi:caffeoyl-CoA O-methyltransferase
MANDLDQPWLASDIAAYAMAHTTPPDELQRALIDETRAALGPRSIMQISADQGAFMELLVAAIGARRAIEVGTFTGYSALCIARALPDDGHLLCCDVSEEWTAVGRRYWDAAGVGDKVELRIGPALDTLRALPEDEVVDVAFIDADKSGYGAYYEELLRRLRPGGLILVDNTLWSGRVLDPAATDVDTMAIKAFNDAVAADSRVHVVLLPISDGVTLIRKRA